jgi:hypothetical protein
MKRKFLQDLLHNRHQVDLRERIGKVIPGSSKGNSEAAQILADTVEAFQAAGSLDAALLYHAVCGSPATELAERLQGSPSGSLNERAVAAAQIVLKDVLTSKAGRKKTSDLSRNEQVAAGMARLREKVKGDRKRLDVWIDLATASNLEQLQYRLGCQNQAQALQIILAAAVEGRVLISPET